MRASSSNQASPISNEIQPDPVATSTPPATEVITQTSTALASNPVTAAPLQVSPQGQAAVQGVTQEIELQQRPQPSTPQAANERNGHAESSAQRDERGTLENPARAHDNAQAAPPMLIQTLRPELATPPHITLEILHGPTNSDDALALNDLQNFVDNARPGFGTAMQAGVNTAVGASLSMGKAMLQTAVGSAMAFDDMTKPFTNTTKVPFDTALYTSTVAGGVATLAKHSLEKALKAGGITAPLKPPTVDDDTKNALTHMGTQDRAQWEQPLRQLMQNATPAQALSLAKEAHELAKTADVPTNANALADELFNYASAKAGAYYGVKPDAKLEPYLSDADKGRWGTFNHLTDVMLGKYEGRKFGGLVDQADRDHHENPTSTIGKIGEGLWEKTVAQTRAILERAAQAPVILQAAPKPEPGQTQSDFVMAQTFNERALSLQAISAASEAIGNMVSDAHGINFGNIAKRFDADSIPKQGGELTGALTGDALSNYLGRTLAEGNQENRFLPASQFAAFIGNVAGEAVKAPVEAGLTKIDEWLHAETPTDASSVAGERGSEPGTPTERYRPASVHSLQSHSSGPSTDLESQQSWESDLAEPGTPRGPVAPTLLVNQLSGSSHSSGPSTAPNSPRSGTESPDSMSVELGSSRSASSVDTTSSSDAYNTANSSSLDSFHSVLSEMADLVGDMSDLLDAQASSASTPRSAPQPASTLTPEQADLLVALQDKLAQNGGAESSANGRTRGLLEAADRGELSAQELADALSETDPSAGPSRASPSALAQQTSGDKLTLGVGLPLKWGNSVEELQTPDGQPLTNDYLAANQGQTISVLVNGQLRDANVVPVQDRQGDIHYAIEVKNAGMDLLAPTGQHVNMGKLTPASGGQPASADDNTYVVGGLDGGGTKRNADGSTKSNRSDVPDGNLSKAFTKKLVLDLITRAQSGNSEYLGAEDVKALRDVYDRLQSKLGNAASDPQVPLTAAQLTELKKAIETTKRTEPSLTLNDIRNAVGLADNNTSQDHRISLDAVNELGSKFAQIAKDEPQLAQRLAPVMVDFTQTVGGFDQKTAAAMVGSILNNPSDKKTVDKFIGELANSPYNVRIGDSPTNSSIGKALDAVEVEPAKPGLERQLTTRSQRDIDMVTELINDLQNLDPKGKMSVKQAEFVKELTTILTDSVTPYRDEPTAPPKSSSNAANQSFGADPKAAPKPTPLTWASDPNAQLQLPAGPTPFDLDTAALGSKVDVTAYGKQQQAKVVQIKDAANGETTKALEVQDAGGLPKLLNQHGQALDTAVQRESRPTYAVGGLIGGTKQPPSDNPTTGSRGATSTSDRSGSDAGPSSSTSTPLAITTITGDAGPSNPKQSISAKRLDELTKSLKDYPIKGKDLENKYGRGFDNIKPVVEDLRRILNEIKGAVDERKNEINSELPPGKERGAALKNDPLIKLQNDVDKRLKTAETTLKAALPPSGGKLIEQADKDLKSKLDPDTYSTLKDFNSGNREGLSTPEIAINLIDRAISNQEGDHLGTKDIALLNRLYDKWTGLDATAAAAHGQRTNADDDLLSKDQLEGLKAELTNPQTLSNADISNAAQLALPGTKALDPTDPTNNQRNHRVANSAVSFIGATFATLAKTNPAAASDMKDAMSSFVQAVAGKDKQQADAIVQSLYDSPSKDAVDQFTAVVADAAHNIRIGFQDSFGSSFDPVFKGDDSGQRTPRSERDVQDLTVIAQALENALKEESAKAKAAAGNQDQDLALLAEQLGQLDLSRHTATDGNTAALVQGLAALMKAAVTPGTDSETFKPQHSSTAAGKQLGQPNDSNTEPPKILVAELTGSEPPTTSATGANTGPTTSTRGLPAQDAPTTDTRAPSGTASDAPATLVTGIASNAAATPAQDAVPTASAPEYSPSTPPAIVAGSPEPNTQTGDSTLAISGVQTPITPAQTGGEPPPGYPGTDPKATESPPADTGIASETEQPADATGTRSTPDTTSPPAPSPSLVDTAQAATNLGNSGQFAAERRIDGQDEALAALEQKKGSQDGTSTQVGAESYSATVTNADGSTTTATESEAGVFLEHSQTSTDGDTVQIIKAKVGPSASAKSLSHTDDTEAEASGSASVSLLDVTAASVTTVGTAKLTSSVNVMAGASITGAAGISDQGASVGGELFAGLRAGVSFDGEFGDGMVKATFGLEGTLGINYGAGASIGLNDDVLTVGAELDVTVPGTGAGPAGVGGGAEVKLELDLGKLWEAIKNPALMAEYVEDMVKCVPEAADGIRKAIMKGIDKLKDAILDDVVGFAKKLGTSAADLAETVGEGVMDVAKEAVNAAKTVADKVGDGLGTAVDAVGDAAGTVVETGTDVVETVVETGTDVVETVVETGTDVVETVVETGTDVVETVVETGSDVVEEGVEWVEENLNPANWF